MTEKAIQNIYNKLLNWEGKHASQPYPIHKRLDAKVFGYNDVYEWIAKTYAFTQNTQVLDAGCGVGYGSIYFAEHYNCKVTGISLSDEEVRKANLFAKTLNMDSHVRFIHQSFDRLEPNSFNFIMAIESIKHTLDLRKSLSSLTKALKPDGMLVIVDDFLVKEGFTSIIRSYSKDWSLKVLLKDDDFVSEFHLKKDLTPFIRTKTSVALSTGILVLSVLKPFFKIAKIARGGLYLEQLFRRKVMKYYVLELKK